MNDDVIKYKHFPRNFDVFIDLPLNENKFMISFNLSNIFRVFAEKSSRISILTRFSLGYVKLSVRQDQECKRFYTFVIMDQMNYDADLLKIQIHV